MNEHTPETLRNLPDGIACSHPGCLSHVTHPCEHCGRIAGRRPRCTPETLRELVARLVVEHNVPCMMEGMYHADAWEEDLKESDEYARLWHRDAERLKAFEAQFRNTGITPYLDRMAEQAACIEALKQWVADLQSGMYINCVYCGHRYGPDSEVASTMADVLKEHIEQCPEHPMSHAKARIAELEPYEKSWLALLREIAKLDRETDWEGADDDTFLEEFDPWHLLRNEAAPREADSE
jgi:hypothetical protein